ncbi:hypothetical protein [Sphingopyxis microcysteis]|uniref:hypothetical protein n=1 Tax=Sphingopyxis microcysteis TaxID=2484145 RepID=UPI001444E637|nr:hypothetical protein [Sphingopyxis microcysteis]
MKATFAFVFLVAACSDGEAEMLADMSLSERTSYEAIKSFNKCMQPHIDLAKRGAALPDDQINEFGLKCPKELEDVAQAMAKRPLSSFHGSISNDEWIPDFNARLAHYRKSFARSFSCELRPGGCPVL